MNRIAEWSITSSWHILQCVCFCRSGNKTELFSDLSGFPVLKERTRQIQTVLSEIQDHRKDIRLVLKAPAFDYSTVSGQEVPPAFVCVRMKEKVGGNWWPFWIEVSATMMVYDGFNSKWHMPGCSCLIYLRLFRLLCLQFLIEVKNSMSSAVPPEWVKISRSAHSCNLHTLKKKSYRIYVSAVFFNSFFEC